MFKNLKQNLFETIFFVFTISAIILLFFLNIIEINKTIPKDKNNIILIIIDTLRADHLGCYGYQRNTSPFLDELAKNNFKFENFFSVSPWTNPTIMTILTGKYPQEFLPPSKQKVWLKTPLPEKFETLAEILKTKGFKTLAMVDHPSINKNLAFDKGFETFIQLSDKWEKTGLRSADPQKILGEFENQIKNLNGNFFIYLHLLYPHFPYTPPSPYKNFFGNSYDTSKKWPELKPEDKPGMINGYDSEIRFTDDFVKKIYSTLENKNLLKNTFFIVTSDHGEEFFEHGRCEHGHSLYKELLKIPLIIVPPQNIKMKPKTIKNQLSNIDLPPTILEMAGFKNHPHFRGKSFLKLLLKNNKSVNHKEFFSESPFKVSIYPIAFQNKNYKLIYHQQFSFNSVFKELNHATQDILELYDLRKDPQEKINLTEKKPLTSFFMTFQVIKHKIECLKKRRLLKINYSFYKKNKITETKKLKSLGYLQ